MKMEDFGSGNRRKGDWFIVCSKRVCCGLFFRNWNGIWIDRILLVWIEFKLIWVVKKEREATFFGISVFGKGKLKHAQRQRRERRWRDAHGFAETGSGSLIFGGFRGWDYHRLSHQLSRKHLFLFPSPAVFGVHGHVFSSVQHQWQLQPKPMPETGLPKHGRLPSSN